MVQFLSLSNLSSLSHQHSNGSHTVEADHPYLLNSSGSSSVDESTQANRQEVDSEAYIMSCDYIQSKLRKNAFNWRECPTLPEPSPLRLAMRSLGEEFERQYKQVFDGMCDTLQVTPTTAYPTFFGVADELFAQGVTWGRVVALFAFGGALSDHCIRKGLPQLVSYVADWVAIYTETHLSPWIATNGGWDGFLRFYERQPHHYGWNSFKRVMTGVGAVCGALGVVTLGAMLASKS